MWCTTGWRDHIHVDNTYIYIYIYLRKLIFQWSNGFSHHWKCDPSPDYIDITIRRACAFYPFCPCLIYRPPTSYIFQPKWSFRRRQRWCCRWQRHLNLKFGVGDNCWQDANLNWSFVPKHIGTRIKSPPYASCSLPRFKAPDGPQVWLGM